MNRAWRSLAVGIGGASLLLAAPLVRAGEIISVTDPRTLEKPVFPDAQVKIVTFEFASVGNDERGKDKAKELHRLLLARIRNVSGGAVVTFTTPARGSIANLKVNADQVARAQKAQMALWGRVLTDKAGQSFINARLTLIEAPQGIEATYSAAMQPRPGVPPLGVRGRIHGPVASRSLDFNVLDTDVGALATFLSGLMRYYRADHAVSAKAAVPWLTDSAAEFERYARDLAEPGNSASLAAALLYAARAHVRLGDAERARQAAHLAAARTELERAARLDPYDAGIPTAQAIVASKLGAPPDKVGPYLTRAVSLAPADGDVRLNLALVESARGNIEVGVQQAKNARYVHQAQSGTDFAPAKPVQQELQQYQNMVQGR